MIIRCSNCNGALKYHMESGKMRCEHCDSLYEMTDVQTNMSEENMMEGEVFVCTSCGARVMVNQTEFATYCAYCGQPTVVFERVSQFSMPEKIIPFSVKREEAEQAIREKLKGRFFVPRAIKRFKVERMCPIYIPFWLVDVIYHDDQMLKGTVKGDDKLFQRNETVTFMQLPVDGSSNFCNESAERLLPYQMEGLKEFQEGYLSGYYADCYDEEGPQIRDEIYKRCKKMYDEESQRAVSGGSVKISQSVPDWKVSKRTYAMLPAWFMTIHYKKKPYTFLVNGQTGKVVGAVLYAKGKVVAMIMAFSAFFLSFIPKFCSNALYNVARGNKEFFDVVLIWLVVTFLAWGLGLVGYYNLKRHIEHASDEKITNYSKKRQKGND